MQADSPDSPSQPKPNNEETQQKTQEDTQKEKQIEFHKAEYISKLSPYAQSQILTYNHPEILSKFPQLNLVGKSVYNELGKVFKENPRIYSHVYYGSLTNVENPKSSLSEESKELWKHFDNSNGRFQKVNFAGASPEGDSWEDAAQPSIISHAVAINLQKSISSQDDMENRVDFSLNNVASPITPELSEKKYVFQINRESNPAAFKPEQLKSNNALRFKAKKENLGLNLKLNLRRTASSNDKMFAEMKNDFDEIDNSLNELRNN